VKNNASFKYEELGVLGTDFPDFDAKNAAYEKLAENTGHKVLKTIVQDSCTERTKFWTNAAAQAVKDEKGWVLSTESLRGLFRATQKLEDEGDDDDEEKDDGEDNDDDSRSVYTVESDSDSGPEQADERPRRRVRSKAAKSGGKRPAPKPLQKSKFNPFLLTRPEIFLKRVFFSVEKVKLNYFVLYFFRSESAAEEERGLGKVGEARRLCYPEPALPR
jgi:hypothetical protein